MAYRVHITPVQVRAVCCAKLILLVSFFKSDRLFTERSHLEVGAQKKIVNGPAGWAAIFFTTPGMLSAVKKLLIRPDVAIVVNRPRPGVKFNLIERVMGIN